MENDVLLYIRYAAEAKAVLCRSANFIGMTTTEVAKKHNFLKALGP